MKKFIISFLIFSFLFSACASGIDMSFDPNKDVYLLYNGSEGRVCDLATYATITHNGTTILSAYLATNEYVIPVVSKWEGQDFIVEEVYFDTEGALHVEEHARMTIIFVDAKWWKE